MIKFIALILFLLAFSFEEYTRVLLLVTFLLTAHQEPWCYFSIVIFSWTYRTNLLMQERLKKKNRYLFWRDCLVASNSAKIKFFSFSVSDWKQAKIRKRNKIVRKKFAITTMNSILSLNASLWVYTEPPDNSKQKLVSPSQSKTAISAQFLNSLHDFLKHFFCFSRRFEKSEFPLADCPAKSKVETSVWCYSQSQRANQQSEIVHFFKFCPSLSKVSLTSLMSFFLRKYFLEIFLNFKVILCSH